MTNKAVLKKIEEAAASKATELDLSWMELTELPPELFQLTGLNRLNLNFNKLTALPPELLQLTNLTSLNLGQNRLTALPPELCRLKNLTELSLWRNQLTSLPLELFQLINLTKLYLGENELTALPPELFQLTNLTALYLSRNKLTNLPPELFQMTGLTTLVISGLKLTTLPLELFQLTNLTVLTLDSNHLTALPPEVCQLTNLTVLDLSNNQLTALPPEMSQLTNLTVLNLWGNGLTALPPELCWLTNLIKLNLFNNQLTALPPELCQLTNLTELGLWGNKLTAVPPELYQLTNLKTIDLGDNPLTSPPLEIADKGIEAIRSYFTELNKANQPVNEVKIILVGEGAAGKTSLTKRLLGEPFDEKEDATHGIRITPWQAEADNRRIKVNIWDFGGQEIMHATHQFFLSKRSLYVLVLDGRRDERPEYWLRHIESFGGDSPVLIVLNKHDANPGFDLNRTFLLGKYPVIRSFHRTSCSTGQGIKRFRERLVKELMQVTMAEALWPKSWFTVKERLEEMGGPCRRFRWPLSGLLDWRKPQEMQKHYISCDEYTTFCQEAGIVQSEDQDVLVDFLNDLGVAVHFTDFKLKDTHVLDPKWVTCGVYKIVTDKAVADNGGAFRLNSLRELLRRHKDEEYCYPEHTHNYILELMKKFQLCYCLDEETALIPQLLPVPEPDFPFDYEGSLRFAFLYDDFLPLSVLPRFIVQRHEQIKDGKVWRTGVLLEDRESGSTAAVKADGEKRRISLWVSGPRRKEYLHFLWYSLREINDSFKKLPVRARVPMPDDPQRTADYETLLKYAERGNDMYIPDGSDKEYSVRELLGLVQPKGQDELRKSIEKIQEHLEVGESATKAFNQIFELKPGIFGIKVNLNELFITILGYTKRKGR